MLDENSTIILENKNCRIIVENNSNGLKPCLQLKSDLGWDTVAFLPPVTIERPSYKNEANYSSVRRVDGGIKLTATICNAKDNNWQVTDLVTNAVNGFVVERTWEYKGSADPTLALLFEVAYEGMDVDFWMIPGIMYNGNPIEGSGYHQVGNGIGPQPGLLYPSGWEWGGVPWAFSEEVPVPSASWVRRGECAIGVFAQPQAELHDLLSSVSLARIEADNQIRSIVYLPSRDVPLVYRDKNGFTPGRYNWLSVNGEWSYTRKFFITLYREETPLPLSGFNRASWEAMSPYRLVPGFNADEVEDLRLNFMLKYHLIQKDNVCGIIQGLHNDGTIRENWLSDGFLGLNVEFAYFLYSNSLRTKNEEHKQTAVKMIEFYLSQQFKNGLFYSNYDLKTGEWGYQFGKTLCFTRPMGERLWNMLELVEIMEDSELKKRILSFCRKSADFFVKNQLPNGSFGKRWNVDGTLEEDSGSNFSFITWFLCRFYQIEKNDEYLRAAENSFEHIKMIIENEEMKYWVDCLDSGAVDREGATAYLQALNALYEVTGKQIYLHYAGIVAEFSLTWQYSYDICFDIDTPLGGPLFEGENKQKSFHSAGMTLVSVEHPCMDAWGARLGYELLKLSDFTGDLYYSERGCAAIMASQQVIARKPGEYGLPLVGSQPEQMDSRDWCYGFIGLGKGSCRVLIAWNQVLNLAVVDRVRRRFPKELKKMQSDF